jgi:hypothetical protein
LKLVPGHSHKTFKMAALDWAVPAPARLKYGQLFNSVDRQRSGFLTGVQARNILLQSGLTQQVLAQIWFLADVDKDGMLTSEEFTLAMHLIDLCKTGKPLPAQLPPDLLPPTIRRKISLVSPTLSDHGRITPVQTPSGRHGSMSSVSSNSSNHVITAGPSPVPVALIEWAVPPASRLKYTQGFNTADKERSGFLTGIQSRGILIQSGLPQQTLAGIWNLSDIDKDGRLSLEEFVLAMHLIDMVRGGEPLPSVLPVDLVPPAYRRKQSLTGAPVAVPTATGAQISVPTGVPIPIPNSGSIQGGDGGLGKHSFEDKRKENFEKGQAELEKRRQMLLDQQRREQEERDRKEREEFEKRERARLEQERRKQEEIERQLAKQREIEQQKEEERRKQLEQREAARREMERQRLIEWESQKKSEMLLGRQRFQEQLLSMRARKNSSAIQAEQVNQQWIGIKQQVDEARERVSGAKQEIDEMRIQRDTRVRDMNLLKAQVKQLHDRQSCIEQERVRLTAQLNSLQANPNSASGGDSTEFALQAKQNRIAQLKQRLQEVEPQQRSKQEDQDRVNVELNELVEQFDQKLSNVEQVKLTTDRKREQAREETDEAARIAEQATQMAATLDFNSGWEDSPPVASSTLASGSISGVLDPSDLSSSSASEQSGVRYQVIYDYNAQAEDDLAFKVGDIITLVPGEPGVSGWLKGRLNGAEGWFPEAYVKKMDDTADSSGGLSSDITAAIQAVSLTESKEQTAVVHTEYEASDDSQMSLAQGDHVKVSDQSQQDWWFGQVNDRSGWFPSACVTLDNATADGNEYYVSIYAFATQETGDLSFEIGDLIRVTKREVEWWTGEIDGRSGIFPANFVRPATQQEIVSLS